MERSLSDNHIRDVLSDDILSDLFEYSSDEFVLPTTTETESDSDSENNKRRKKRNHGYKKKLKFGTERNSNAQKKGPENPQVSDDKQDEPEFDEEVPDLQTEQNITVDEPIPNKRKESNHLCRKKLRFGTERNSNEQETRPENPQVSDREFDEEVAPDLQTEQNITVDEPIPNNDLVLNTPKKNVRKKIPNPTKWKCNIIKRAHNAGKEYISKRGKSVSPKEVKTVKNCQENCKYKCAKKITNDERFDIHVSFYSLRDSTEKRHFFLNTTVRTLTQRPKKRYIQDDGEIRSSGEEEDTENQPPANKAESRRKYSFLYFFNVNGEKVQVCKSFYLSTLDISQKPVYTAHKTKNVSTNTPTIDLRGKNCNSRRKPEGDADFARLHIKSFPVVESHYCRANTSRLYLGSHLNIAKMYDLYIENCRNEDKLPIKKSMYYRIFGTEFNLGFHLPKSDRCDVCEAYMVAKNTETLTEEQNDSYEIHVVRKNQMRQHRKNEKENKNLPVLLFDLQNVIMCPHADISSLFYMRKLNVYNLTAYFTLTKKVYCAIWNETMSGRAGNDIASAVRRILDAVVEENEITELITWSDSCVPQNRNSHISNAILDFLRENPNITSVTMKYSLPGHSCVQEVDHVHSSIEKSMNKTDFYSPLGLVRLLKTVDRHNPYRIIQMKASDFKDFAGTAKLLNYKRVPFTQVAVLKFTQEFATIFFKVSHDEYEPENAANIKFLETPRREKKLSPSSTLNVFDVKPKQQKCSVEISEAKKKDIKDSLIFMPLQDREYFKTLLKL